MPIRIPDKLPAKAALERENIFVMGEDRALHQDIRPLRILLLNLMPNKLDTETQLLRLLSNSPLQVDVELLQTMTHVPKHTPQEHLLKFYKGFQDIQQQYFDGLIITGAPLEQMAFEEVDYWPELCEILDWAKTHVFSVFSICWGAQAALYYYYRIPKYPLPQKMFGIYPHQVLVPRHNLLRGFDEVFYVPHSRHTETRAQDIENCPDLQILTYSHLAGVHIVADNRGRNFFVTGHSEYDRDSLANEYFRDRSKGLPIQIPYNYFPDDNPENVPYFNWRSHANLLLGNWLDHVIYQNTPYDLRELTV
ncbi:MAG TPA: homoserine O-succinyltransferase [Firmicutes bacterium]|nr:homoserine O-succinyltransferase [Bacillota bacterium]